ncbi:MAG: hypothetical protein HGA24_00775 [Candidatus Aminicenantes bacterium]|nr:hypothetical protein [Candidatus Aminicenantes bacterium]
MKNGRAIGWGLAAMLVSTQLASLPSSRLAGQTNEKICPITFRLYPGTKLESGCAARIEKDNVTLSGFLSELRMTEGLMKYRATVGTILADARLSPAQREQALQSVAPMVASWLKHRPGGNPFLGTYLEVPRLTTETGVIVEGLDAVIVELARIVASSTYVDAQSVHVGLEYLPFGSPGYVDAQVKYPAKPGEEPVDIIAHVSTILAYAPYDDPVRIAGALPHRRVCFD